MSNNQALMFMTTYYITMKSSSKNPRPTLWVHWWSLDYSVQEFFSNNLLYHPSMDACKEQKNHVCTLAWYSYMQRDEGLITSTRVHLLVLLLLSQTDQFTICTILFLHQTWMCAIFYVLPSCNTDMLSAFLIVEAYVPRQPFLALHNSIKCLLNHILWLSIQGTGGLVKKQYCRALDVGASNGDPLLLPSWELDSTLTDFRLLALWEGTDKGVCILHADLWFCGTLFAKDDVLIDCWAKWSWLLLNQANVFPEGSKFEPLDIFTCTRKLLVRGYKSITLAKNSTATWRCVCV